MKRTVLITIVSILATFQATAQTVANGYYRVQNNASGRYVTIRDNIPGTVDMSSTNIDLSNIVTWKGFDNVKSNPASIIYVEQVKSQYNLKGQGTSIYDIAGGKVYIDLIARDGGLWIMSASYGGFTGRLYDSNDDSEKGYVKRTGDTAYQYWKFTPVDTDKNYIGLQPNVQVGDSWYGTIYASYPFKVVSSGVTVYYVDGAKDGVFELKEVTDAVKPAATPLLFKCSSNDPAKNKITPVTDATTAPTDNLLGGTYFACNVDNHEVYVRYDNSTMRVLGKNDAGELAFVSASTDYLTKKKFIPMNTCWLNIPAGSTGDFKLVSRDEFTGIRNINATEANDNKGTFTLTGVRVNESTLSPGIYIRNGKKVIIK